MITTLPPTTAEVARGGTIRTVAAPGTDSTAIAVVDTTDRPWLPYAIGALLGMLVVLALAVWMYLTLNGGDYSGVIDLSQAIQL